MKKLDKILMSKGMGKVLDSKISKKVMIPLGKKVIKIAKKPFMVVGNAIEKEWKMQDEQNKKWKEEYEDELKGKVSKRGRSTSDGRMVG